MSAPLEPHFPELPLIVVPRLGGDFGACPRTGVIYNLRAESKSYEGDYFLAEYAAQYGRTYVEDEPHLRTLARRRLTLAPAPRAQRATASLSWEGPPRLLEIGCAAGFFLDEARRAGYSVQGLEISEFAASFGRATLQLSIDTASFLDCELAAESFDVIAAFYVIEHFAAQRTVFRKIAAALKPGGRFLFALPSTHGPLFEYHVDEWLRTHPTDHHADYSPASLRRLLPEYGLQVRTLRPAAYHPARAGGWKAARWLRPLYRAYAKRFCYGDTLEGIAEKTN